MNNKFYVSYEAARLLKEKGYNEKVDYMYDDGELALIKTLTNEQIDRYYRTMYDGVEFYGAPTKTEAIDWLDSKGLIVDTKYYSNRGNNRGKWSAHINRKDSWAYVALGEYYLTRLEAEEAAIIKACELL